MPIWATVTFGIGYFARELDFTMLGWPFSFWVGAQGALIVYVALVACYAKAMNRLDRLTNAGDADPLLTAESVTSPPGSSSGERTAAPATSAATHLHDRS
jgi:putative solute:sodium symporter small subunit